LFRACRQQGGFKRRRRIFIGQQQHVSASDLSVDQDGDGELTVRQRKQPPPVFFLNKGHGGAWAGEGIKEALDLLQQHRFKAEDIFRVVVAVYRLRDGVEEGLLLTVAYPGKIRDRDVVNGARDELSRGLLLHGLLHKLLR